MSISIVAFVVCAVVASAFLAAMTFMESGLQWPEFKQAGDSSLGRNSINWMGGIAFATAAFICFVLV